MPKVTEAYLEARRDEILEAAITCFTNKGFHQTTMDDICRQAKLSPGAVYRYFASKEEIIDAAVRKGRDPGLARWFEEEVSRYDDFLESIDMFTRLYYQRFEPVADIEMAMKLRLRAWAEALQNPEVREEVLRRWEISLGVIEKMVRRGQELGQINPDLDPGAAARVLEAVGDGFTLQWVIDPGFDVWQFREVELALYGGTFFCGQNEAAD